MIKRQELVNDILDIYDYVDHLEKEVERLKPYSIKEEKENSETLTHIDYLMISIGKQKILDSCLYSWREVKAEYDEENDTYNVTSYNDWLNEKLRRDEIPDSISLDEFRVYFRKELQEIYEKEKSIALNKAKVEEE
jgi:hypothetical protein|nr:MAG TPA: hypothetical protein [Caudoviricetes sp.]